MSNFSAKRSDLVSVSLKAAAVSLVIGLLPLLASAQTRLPSTTIRGTAPAVPSTTTVTAPAATLNTTSFIDVNIGPNTIAPTNVSNTGSVRGGTPTVFNEEAVRSAPVTTTVMTAATVSQPTAVSAPSIMRYDTMPVSVVLGSRSDPGADQHHLCRRPSRTVPLDGLYQQLQLSADDRLSRGRDDAV